MAEPYVYAEVLYISSGIAKPLKHAAGTGPRALAGGRDVAAVKEAGGTIQCPNEERSSRGPRLFWRKCATIGTSADQGLCVAAANQTSGRDDWTGLDADRTPGVVCADAARSIKVMVSMPQDPLQIALEHHRSGRLRLAEAGYRQMLRDDPGNADGLHWLGVLLYQAGESKEAVCLLEQAAAMRPADAAFAHNLGQAFLAANQPAEAIQVLERAAKLEPGRTETLMALGLALQATGDTEAAVFAWQLARMAGLDSAELRHHLGVALLAEGRAEEAIGELKAAIDKRSDDAVAHFHVAMAYRQKEDAKEAHKWLIKALELDQGLARAWCGLAVLDAEAGKLAEAAALFRRAIAAKRDYAAAYQGLGRVLREAGKQDESLAAMKQAVKAARGEIVAPGEMKRPATVEELERKLTPEPAAAELHYALATLSHVIPPSRVPARAVANLFDKYAENFDDHLVNRLQYRVPELIAGAVAATKPDKLLDVLDLGCGTGLCGMLLRPMASTLAGVDLSAGMIEKSKSRGVYDTLEVSDLVDAMRKAGRAFDLVAAGDVLNYLGDLSLAFEAAAGCLRAGGLFAFSVEAGGGDRYELQQKNRRFSHSKPYLEKLAAMHGFDIESFETVVPRIESEKPVTGYLVVLRRSSRLE